MDTASSQAATIEKFIDGWKRWNASEMLAVFADDFTQVTLPFGLGVPERKRDAVERALPALVGIVSNYKLTIHEVLHDAAKSKAAVYAVSTGESPFGPWEMEYAAFLHFSKAGDKIVRLEEMLDSAFTKDFAPKFQKYLQDRQAECRA
ncbi:S-adenosyl-L-methionine-dependent methyltransferase [Colletotrichum scovillei]|nr:S-adenosyl-L-methionine-dependent methyltransferase [Colletotrichum scovillei]